MHAITAITGKVGGVVAHTLLDSGQKVRAIVRDAKKGAPWAARGCEIAVADMNAVEPLTRAFSGVESAFVLLPPLFDPAPGFPEARAQIAVIRQALAAARPKKVVVLSTVGADASQPNLLDALRLLEEGLDDLDLPITVLRAAWFMDNAAWDLAAAREQGVIRSYLQPLDRPIPMIATADVGCVAADLMQEAWIGHRVVELEAATRVSPNDIAAAFAAALDRPVRAEIVPRFDWNSIFRAEGMANPGPRARMLDGFNQGWIDFAGGGAEARKGSVSLQEVIDALVFRRAAAA